MNITIIFFRINEDIKISIFNNKYRNKSINYTKLKYHEKSELKCNEIKLNALKEGEKQNLNCLFKRLEKTI